MRDFSKLEKKYKYRHDTLNKRINAKAASSLFDPFTRKGSGGVLFDKRASLGRRIDTNLWVHDAGKELPDRYGYYRHVWGPERYEPVTKKSNRQNEIDYRKGNENDRKEFLKTHRASGYTTQKVVKEAK